MHGSVEGVLGDRHSYSDCLGAWVLSVGLATGKRGTKLRVKATVWIQLPSAIGSPVR